MWLVDSGKTLFVEGNLDTSCIVTQMTWKFYTWLRFQS